MEQAYEELVRGAPLHMVGSRPSNVLYIARCGMNVYLGQQCAKAHADENAKKQICPKLHNPCVATNSCLTGERFVDKGTPKYVLERRAKRRNQTPVRSEQHA